MKVVLFGTSKVGLPILEALIHNHEVVHVVTSPDSKVGRKQDLQQTPIAELAGVNNIPVSKPEKVKNNSDFIEFLKSLEADIFIVVSYGKILPGELLDIPALKTLNVHFSLLPKYRGPAPIQFALLNDEKITGTTIFVLDELVDHGPVLIQKQCDISPTDTFETLADKLSVISAEVLIDLLPKYQSGEIIPQPQDHDLATKTGIINKDDGKINWTQQTAQDIYNHFRAFTPWPGIWTVYNGDVLKVLSCEVVSKPEDSVQKDIIACANNTFLKLKAVQLAGKNKMTMKDFLNGHSDFTTADLVS